MKIAFVTLIFDFQVSLNKISLFEIGREKPYIDWDKTNSEFGLVYHNELKYYLEEVLQVTENGAPISIYMSGVFIRLLSDIDPSVIEKLKEAIASGNLEMVGGPYSTTLSALYSLDQFKAEIKSHRAILASVFNTKASSFYNTENIYCNQLAELANELGFKRIFAGAIPWYLDTRQEERVFVPKGIENFHILVVDKGNALFDNKKQKTHFLQFDIATLRHYRGLNRILLATRHVAKLNKLTDCHRYNSKELYYIKTPTMGSLNGKGLNSYNGKAMQNNVIDMYYSISEQAGTIDNSDFMLLGQSAHYLTLNPDNSDSDLAFEKYSNLMNILNDADLKA